MTIAAMKQALEALESRGVSMYTDDTLVEDAITALRAAISEQEKAEPVAYKHLPSGEYFDQIIACTYADDLIPLYTHPAPVPAGWQLVPVEPTPENLLGADSVMHKAAERVNVNFSQYSCRKTATYYKAMLQAAPKPGDMK